MFAARIAIATCLLALSGTLSLRAQEPAKQLPEKVPPAGPDRAGGVGDPTPGKNEVSGETSDDKALEQRREEIRERIQRERARRLTTNIVRTHVAVRVRLRNGERLQGIVKDGNFVERPSGGLEFVRAEMTQEDAGLRLWYYNRTDGYIFLPYTMIETYKVLKRLTDTDIKVIHDEIKEAEKLANAEAEKRGKQLAEKSNALKQGEAAADKAGELSADLAAKKKRAEEDAAALALIDEFPPDEGWGEERINQINIRRLTVRVFPNEKERRFIELFEQWKKGRDVWLAKKSKELGEKHDAKTDAKTDAKQQGATGGSEPGKDPSATGETKDAGKSKTTSDK